MSQARNSRIEAQIQRVLATLIAREVKDPRVGNVTVTAVRAAADMGSVRVYFTPFVGSSHPPEQVRAALTHAAGFLRGELGRRLSLRHAPRLDFVFDDSQAQAAHLDELIDRAVSGDRANAAHGGNAAGATQPRGHPEDAPTTGGDASDETDIPS